MSTLRVIGALAAMIGLAIISTPRQDIFSYGDPEILRWSSLSWEMRIASISLIAVGVFFGVIGKDKK